TALYMATSMKAWYRAVSCGFFVESPAIVVTARVFHSDSTDGLSAGIDGVVAVAVTADNGTARVTLIAVTRSRPRGVGRTLDEPPRSAGKAEENERLIEHLSGSTGHRSRRR